MFCRRCLIWANWRWTGNLKVLGTRKKFSAYLEKHYMPDLRSAIVTQRIFTPHDFKTELNSRFGSAFSLEPSLLQSAYFRVHNRDRNIRGLYFVGAGTHPGAGIPGVVNSAKATAGLILDDMKAVMARVARKVKRCLLCVKQCRRKSKRRWNECRWMITKGFEEFFAWQPSCSIRTPGTRLFFFMAGAVTVTIRWMTRERRRAKTNWRNGSRQLKENTNSAFSFAQQREPVFVALQYIVHRYWIPAHYALELIEGMAMDARGTRYATLKELLLYCYRVAGTVGLMMSHVMGLRDESALKHAADLGIAMQLTNIARDITEDAAMGRIYLPLSWLQEAQIPVAEIAAREHREKLAMLSLRLLREADRYYRSGDAGLWHLSFRSACAVSAARQVYSEIGSLLLRKGTRAWDQRTYVTGPLKVWVVLRGVRHLLGSVPGRLWRPWSPAHLRMVWKYSNVQ